MTGKYKEALKKAKKTKKTEKPKKEDVPKTELVPLTNKVVIREEDLTVDSPVLELVEKVREGFLAVEDLSVDDKFVIIRYMREEEGLRQDDIAAELGVTRRTVVNYCQKIRKMRAQELADTDVWDLGGDLYAKGVRAMEDALKKGKYKDFAYLMTSMISTLQSMGLVFKLPKQTQSQIQQNITQEINAKKGVEGFQKLKNISEDKEVNLDNVFNELLGAVKDGKLDVDKEE